jgi:hypothetical protein
MRQRHVQQVRLTLTSSIIVNIYDHEMIDLVHKDGPCRPQRNLFGASALFAFCFSIRLQ